MKNKNKPFKFDGEKYLLWTGENQEEIRRFLGKRIRVLAFKPHLYFNGFHIKKGTYFCDNRYGGLDFLTEEELIHKKIIKKYYLDKQKIKAVIKKYARMGRIYGVVEIESEMGL